MAKALERIVFALAVPAVVVGGYLLLQSLSEQRQQQQKKYALTIEATEGGTTKPTPNTYYYYAVTNVTVVAIPSVDYDFKGWYLDGQFQNANLSINVKADAQHVLIASFLKKGQPPLIPAYIKPIQNCSLEHWWHTWLTFGGGYDTLHLGHWFYNDSFVKFKICDAAGNGVADQDIAVYGDPQPDATDYGYLEFWRPLAPGVFDFLPGLREDPVILKSDGAGEVLAKLRYTWFEVDSDYRDTIGTGGKVSWSGMFAAGEQYPIYEGFSPGLFREIHAFTRVKHPIYRNFNPVHAFWMDNPNLPMWGDCVADCMIKIEESKQYSR